MKFKSARYEPLQRALFRARGLRQGRRLPLALVISAGVHALLLSMIVGGHGVGLPGLSFPWQERRIELSELSVTLAPTPPAVAQPSVAPVVPVAEPLPDAPAKPVATDVLTLSEPPAPLPMQVPVQMPVQAPVQTTEQTAAVALPPANPTPDSTIKPIPEMLAMPPLQADPALDAVAPPLPPPPQAIPAPEVIAMMSADQPAWTVPAVQSIPTPAIAAASSASSPDTPTPVPDADDVAQQRAIEQVQLDHARQAALRKAEQLAAAQKEAARAEAARQLMAKQEAVRQETARVEAARLEAQRQQAAQQALARQETARAEAARLEAQRQQAAAQQAAAQQAAAQQAAAQQAAAQRAAAQQAAAHQAAAQQAAAQQAAIQQEAARQEAARLEAARREAADQAAAQAEVAQAAARREAALQAIGRQLNEEADRRKAEDAARQSSSNLPSASSLRRGWLFGRSDPDAELVRYGQAWTRKIELNMTFEMVREAAKQPHTDPMVMVAVRSDGSVESISIVSSSGVPALDDAVRRVVQSQEHYPAFPPALADEYDVIEIRRTWHFDTAIRLN